MVYETSMQSEMYLVARVAVAVGYLTGLKNVISLAGSSLQRSSQLCIEVGGNNFEYLL